MPAPEPPSAVRPSIRRKSSAPSFAPIGAVPALPPPAQTPTMTRDWDIASGGDPGTAPLATTPATGSPSLGGQGTSVEYLRDLVQKRIITLNYMRDVHEGRTHWFHTILMSRTDLDRVFNNNAMKKRTYRFAVLGMSLSNLLDIQQPHDLLRGILNTMIEYDQSKEEGDKPKKRLFRNRPGKRLPGSGFAESWSDGSDASYLVTPHIPFPLDYHQTLLSLLSVLSSIYAKITKFLGPSPFPHQHMMGPLGLLSPQPGVSYLFEGSEGGEVGSSLWDIANATLGAHGAGAAMGSPPAGWSPTLGEMIVKVDGKFRKITSTLLKEFDAFARNGIKDELATLDPLLRNVASADDGGREQYDFEGIV